MGTLPLWIGFNLFVLLMLAVDLGVFHRRAQALSVREAAAWSALWVVVSLLLGLGLWRSYGSGPALEFFTGYLIEKSLSADNLFVFTLLFSYFSVEPRYQHRVLLWGVLGALVMRGAIIALGVVLIGRFHWVFDLLGAFVFYLGLRMMFGGNRQIHPEKNPIFRRARKLLPMTPGYEGQRFFVRRDRVWRATPLVLVLLVVETTDLAFALDSIPAVFAITRDPFIVYSSNICAILGLRALYFLLTSLLPYFRYLSHGLAVVLVFIGAKMLGARWIRISTPIALAIVGGILLIAVLASALTPLDETKPPRKLPEKESPTMPAKTPTEV